MKQRIVLTESKLRNMIKEAVIQTLNEGKVENNKPFDNPLSNSHWNDRRRPTKDEIRNRFDQMDKWLEKGMSPARAMKNVDRILPDNPYTAKRKHSSRQSNKFPDPLERRSMERKKLANMLKEFGISPREYQKMSRWEQENLWHEYRNDLIPFNREYWERDDWREHCGEYLE